MGGQVHVRCACNEFPLIPTNARKDSKQKCHWCHRVELFVCCNTKCNLCLCSRCYRDQQTDVITIIDPTFEVDDDNNPGDPSRDEGDDVASQGNDDNERENDDGYNDGVIHEEDSGKQNKTAQDESEENQEEEEEDIDPVPPQDEEEDLSNTPDWSLDDDPRSGDGLITYTDIDESHDQTEDNIDLNEEYFTTQAGDYPVSIEHHPYMDQVSGHVMYNQAAVCTVRNERHITGTQMQRHFVQKLCATIPGQACPLLTLEGCLGFGSFLVKCN